MNHIEFIEKHVLEELVRQGFTAAVAQGGGHFRLSICTSACLRQVARGGFLMMFCVTRNYGQRSNHCLRTSLKRSALSVISRNQGCSERVKTVVRQHSQSSGAKTVGNCGDQYVKYR
ncbi:hypothetical protein [Citrobacter freundii]|uniref:hypothetical protein n=1 Tax=Citrobacter freundii TaxID=546 RepID=UPI0024E07578|nr:hypothetical protein [Citrobacter freundii]WOR57255.1 hypothetical protein R5Q27_12030 [Citrobacter freundii]